MKKKLIGMLAGISMCACLLSGCNDGTKLQNYTDYVTLGQYTEIEYTPMSTEVTEEELKEQVDSFLAQLGERTELTEGTVKDGDIINLDYIGYADGEAFEGGNTEGKGADLTIGSHRYIDDFEEQLIGHEIGEEGIEVNVTFPDDYKNMDGTPNELAGKDATFICKINTIYQIDYPEELTDELVAANTSYETVNSFMDALKMDFENYKTQQADYQMKVDIITAVIDNATVNSYPEDEVATLTEKTIQGAKDTAASYEVEYSVYLSQLQDKEGNPYTEESYATAAEDYVRELLEEKMVICQIADKEGITVTKQEIDEYVKAECSENTSITPDSMYERYTMEELSYAVIYDKVIAFLVEKAIAISE